MSDDNNKPVVGRITYNPRYGDSNLCYVNQDGVEVVLQSAVIQAKRIQELETALREIITSCMVHDDVRRSFTCKYCGVTCHEDNLITLEHETDCVYEIANKALGKDN